MTAAGILVLDLASNTGWANWHPERGVEFSSRQFVDHAAGIALLLDVYEQWLSDKITTFDPAALYYERPYVAPTTHQDTAIVLMSMAGLTELICRRRDLACAAVNVASWRKTFLGTTKGDGATREARRLHLKRQAIEACNARGWNVRNDDQADALGILVHAAKVSGIAPELADKVHQGTLLEVVS